MFKTIPKEENSLSSIVFNRLKKAIFSGQLKPGQRLIESSLIAQFGVSSSPLREAIKKLEAENLVEVIPYKGARVAKASPQDIEDIYAAVGLLQGYAAKLATPRLEASHIDKMKQLHMKMQSEELKRNVRNWLKVNDEFHRVSLDACQRPKLINMIYEKIGPLDWYTLIASRYMVISNVGMMDGGINEHGRIIAAFEDKDSELARRLVENHLITSGQMLRKHLENIEVDQF